MHCKMFNDKQASSSWQIAHSKPPFMQRCVTMDALLTELCLHKDLPACLVSAHSAVQPVQVCVRMQDISNVSPWSQITAQFNLFNSGSGSTPATASTAGRKLLQNSSFADYESADTTSSDLTKEGDTCRVTGKYCIWLQALSCCAESLWQHSAPNLSAALLSAKLRQQPDS